MRKKLVVRSAEDEHRQCQQGIRKLKGTNQKVRRAQILLKADENGPGGIDQQIAEAINCRSTVFAAC
ncbi:MAG: hypothetical protein KatS3mg110_3422 [Pirellulaceae bacterium]|nr:MAG: hypothetical protein KatS3mg110_3422 [Pirellulaceae bacterium]